MDYRYFEIIREEDLINFKGEKESFLLKYREKHPISDNHYENIRSKSSTINKGFRKIYLYTCVYCGVDTRVLDEGQFEVDHFIPKLFEKAKNKHLIPSYLTEEMISNLNKIDNLVCACQTCNRWKSGFFCKEDENFKKLKPDNNEIHKIFFRDKDSYQIKIYSNYQNNTDVNDLYTKLRLGNQFRRIEHFIKELSIYRDSLDRNDEIKGKISEMLISIDQKRKSTANEKII